MVRNRKNIKYIHTNFSENVELGTVFASSTIYMYSGFIVFEISQITHAA